MDEDSDIGDAKDDGSSDIMPGLADGDNLSPRSDGLGDSNDDITDFFSKHNWTSGQWIFYANLFKTNDCDELQLGLDYSEVEWVDFIPASAGFQRDTRSGKYSMSSMIW